MGRSMPNHRKIVRTPSDFDETWCVCSAYGAYHSCQFLAPYTTWFLIYDHKYFEYFIKNWSDVGYKINHNSSLCYYFKTKIQ